MASASRKAHLQTFGFVVLRDVTDSSALSAEFDAAMTEAFTDASPMISGSPGNEFHYVPMMTERTPVSLGLVMSLSIVASELLGGPVLPGRAKGTRYRGPTKWHRDSDLPLRSLGFAFYLEPLGAADGALQVLPGSHGAELAAAIGGYAAHATDLPGVAVPTVPGDAIVFDERLYHASAGGGLRRQWRVDFVVDMPGQDAALREYFARQYLPEWDGGYDVEKFPSYGARWRTLNARWNERLEALGAYGAAETEEAFARARRLTQP